jgi:hypothetical protein
MSQFTFFASNAPLEAVSNPHAKEVSLNEAVALGMEIPDGFGDDYYRDKPGVLLWTDNDFDFGDIIIFEANWCKYKTYSDKMQYNSIIQWVYSEKRAEQFIAYIRNHLATTDSMELWYIWLDSDNEIENIPESIVIGRNDLTARDLAKYEENDAYIKPLRMTIRRN